MPTPTPTPPPPPSPPQRLLLVDDDPLLRSMAARTLRHVGFEVIEVDSGEQALHAFEAPPTDLVLLDVMMAGIDGFETCRRLRAPPFSTQVPVLMLTGLNDTESIERAYQAGATDFITKPIHWALLAHRVRYALRANAARLALERSGESLARAQRLANMGNWAFSRDGHMSCSEELARIFGADSDAMRCASPEAFLQRVCDADRERVTQARQQATQAGVPYQIRFAIERFDGTLRTVSEQAVPVHDSLGQRVGIEGITQDITERVEAEREVRQLALYDGLTGLPNRLFFLELAGSALERARRAGVVCAFLHLDIDQFRSVNDALGRAGGDLVLRTVAERLQAGTRGSDIAAVGQPPRTAEVVARIGANGFTLLLYGLAHQASAGNAAKRLIREVERPILVGERDVVLTASVGVSLFPRDGDSASLLAAYAEQALYAAKKAGRSQHRFFDEGLNAMVRQRLEREVELRHAIDEGQLRLHFQPKVDATCARIVGIEALVRWQHPTRGLVPPGEFIPLAEETGLILPLTDWVLEAACAAMARWQADGLVPLTMSVNVASPSFMAETLVERLDALVHRHALVPAQLMLEVTETMLMAEPEPAIARMHALRARGYKLSLDDFGTGYSSLSLVKRFPIDELKIDRSFVNDVQLGGRDAALIGSIITLARLLELQLVAEGVETAQQGEILQALGCAVHQGYFYARPMPADALAAMLAAMPAGAQLPTKACL